MGVIFRETRLGTWGMQTEFPPVPTCAPPGSFAPSLGSWEFFSGGRAPERELPTAYPSPTFPTEQTSGRGWEEGRLGGGWGEVGGRLGGG